MAQRCFAALGNASKAFYLSETMKIAEKYEETTGPGLQCPEVRVRLSLLNADLRYLYKSSHSLTDKNYIQQYSFDI